MAMIDGCMIIHKCLIISFIFSALITTIADDAGTLLLNDPVTHPEEYERFDKAFRDACCMNGGGCEKYLSTHPINDGSGYKPPKGCKCLRMHILSHAGYIYCLKRPRSRIWRSSLHNS